MKILYIGDNRNRGNYGCRATSTALSMLIREKNKITGIITGKNTSKDTSELFFYSPLPQIAYSFFGKHTFLRDVVKVILHRFKFFSYFGSFDFVSLDFEKSRKNLLKCIPANPQLRDLLIDQYDFDAVVVNGEGSFIFGKPQWREPLVLTMLIHWVNQKHKPVYLANVMFSDSTSLPHNQDSIKAINSVLKNCSQIIVREKTSYNYIKKHFVDIEPSIIPDALFSWHKLITEAPAITNGKYCLAHSAEQDEAYFNLDFSKPYILIAGSSAFVGDTTKSIPAYVQLVQKLRNIYKSNIFLIQTCEGDKFLSEVSSITNAPLISMETPILAAAKILSCAKAFITGRYHPAILASHGGTPCVFMDSNSHKTRSLQDVLQYPSPREYHAIPSEKEIDLIIEDTLKAISLGKPLRETIANRCKFLSNESHKLADIL
ncbi:MAG: polysaccharide pyruvyl transferase family protein [Fibrobacter sp.]|uniref:polysaccharide pyruvyl transferase family protein n=1 Tax=Fibrobacter sp. TaxID=35828 RepID=UPI0025C26D31|nr:polysaccharide pyruvyl transferase family protein [Fibrobacter sp.]MBR4785330.1 polysaccharide pyruvyl transferase family protein [Fibrobacter sp.]